MMTPKESARHYLGIAESHAKEIPCACEKKGYLCARCMVLRMLNDAAGWLQSVIEPAPAGKDVQG